MVGGIEPPKAPACATQASPNMMDQLSPFVAAQMAILLMLTIRVPHLVATSVRLCLVLSLIGFSEDRPGYDMPLL